SAPDVLPVHRLRQGNLDTVPGKRKAVRTSRGDVRAQLPCRIVIVREACRAPLSLGDESFIGLARNEAWCETPLALHGAQIGCVLKIEYGSWHARGAPDLQCPINARECLRFQQ